jgi:hypothetical protein
VARGANGLNFAQIASSGIEFHETLLVTPTRLTSTLSFSSFMSFGEDEIGLLRAEHKNAVPTSTQLSRAARRWIGKIRFFRCEKRILIFFGFDRLNKLAHRKAI